jgi:lipid-A-disaccharide synthase
MKYYIIAGEASGDLHASNLIKALHRKDPHAHIRAWGGDLMQEAGAEIIKHYRDLAFMGFAEVLMNLPEIFRNMRFCKKDILQFQPDVLILVDYPGFNLRIAEFAKEHKIRVVYYISPQVWAWKKGRVHTIRRVVDKMLVILPFEKEFYRDYGIEVDFVGHPLLDAISSIPIQDQNFRQNHNLDSRPIIALLPGSRKQEIGKMLSVMLGITNYFVEYQFVIGGAPSVEVDFYQKITQRSDVKVVYGQTQNLLRHATAALVASGTATLETALLDVPQVVCYRGNAFSYAIAKRLVHLRFISLVNLIMDRMLVTELIQDDLNSKNLIRELNLILKDQTRIETLKSDYKELRDKLGGKGASEKAAQIVVDFLHQ